jgi:hypothetical protein
MRQLNQKALEADNAKGMNEILAELAVEENNFLEAANFYHRQAVLNGKLGIPYHRQMENYHKYSAIHTTIQAFDE